MKITEQDKLTIDQVFKDFDKFIKTGDGDYFCVDRGLCHNVFDLIDYHVSSDADLYCAITHIKVELFESWEYFSGDPSYPIPFRYDQPQDEEILRLASEGLGLSARSVYYNTDNMYDKTTDYGQLRLDLYQHIKDNIFDVINEL